MGIELVESLREEMELEEVVQVSGALHLCREVRHDLYHRFGGEHLLLLHQKQFQIDPEVLVLNAVQVQEFSSLHIRLLVHECDQVLAKLSQEMLEGR